MEVQLGLPQKAVVLIVDDDKAVSRLIRQNLESDGTAVLEAATGFEGIRAIRDSRIDLVILDLRLPDFDGLGILGLLRLTRSLNHIPVIIVSVDQPDFTLAEYLRPDDYVRKPFNVSDLLSKVRKLIRDRSFPGHSGSPSCQPAPS